MAVLEVKHDEGVLTRSRMVSSPDACLPLAMKWEPEPELRECSNMPWLAL